MCKVPSIEVYVKYAIENVNKKQSRKTLWNICLQKRIEDFWVSINVVEKVKQ